MEWRRFGLFAGKTIVVHVVTYVVVGAAAYFLFTRSLYEGPNPVFASFMRTQSEPELWEFVMRWQPAGQVARGFLIGAVLYPFFETLISWSYWRRFLSIAGLYLVLGFWASTVAAPGTIDGLIYLRPEITIGIHGAVQVEIVLQGLALAAWLSKWMSRGCVRENRQPKGKS